MSGNYKVHFQVVLLRDEAEDEERLDHLLEILRSIFAKALFCGRPSVDLNQVKDLIELKSISTVSQHIHSDCLLISCTLNGALEQFNVEGLIRKMSRTRATDGPLSRPLWLQLDANCHPCPPLFEAKLCANHSHENALSVEGFSFGSLIDLVYFVPHFDASFGSKANDILTSSIDFEHDKRRLLLKFRVKRGNGRGNDLFEFILDYSHIKRILLSRNRSAKSWSIYLSLILPPLLYKVTHEKDESTSGDEQQEVDLDDEEEAGGDKDWLANISNNPYVQLCRETTFPRMKEPSIVGRSRVLRVQLKTKGQTENQQWKELWEAIKNLQRFSESKTPIYVTSITHSVKQTEVAFGNNHNYLRSQLESLRFNIRFAVYCIWMASYQLLDELVLKEQLETFVELLKDFAKTDEKALEFSLYDLFAAIDSQEPVSSISALKALFEKHGREKDRKLKNKNICDIRRCILTPTRLLLLPPLPFLESRFLRNYNPDHAIRLYLKDDNLESISFTVKGNPQHQDKFFKKYIVDNLLNGLDICGRVYEYLGSSTSQLRDYGMFIYSRDVKGRTAPGIRRDLGDLHLIRNPAKYVARIGQNFSQPMAHIPRISRDYVTPIEDIMGGTHPESKKPYNFSDGVGKISQEMAIELAKTLGKEDMPPSAYQIRYAGCKGMLVIDPTLTGKLIQIRPSMKKFESPSESMEILKVSEPRYVYLNRPLVNILNQRGVPTNVFLKLQLQVLRELTYAFLCNCRSVLLLKSSAGLKLPYESLMNVGVDLLGEPFFRGIIEAVAKRNIKDVKGKARIRLPDSYGRVMFGVLDETDSLKYGQVFAQYSDEYAPHAEATLVTGKVVITKFPCTHPGDVRKFTAVDVPALRHIKDCLVFGAKGKRPHPNEMAGSDLDGDEYTIIWEPSLIFPAENYKAMDYPDTESTSLDRPVEKRDILEFYCEFVKDRGVGIIANAHLALSDQLADGIYHQKCMSLAHKYAVALDYAKTGQNDPITAKDKPILYPDFMDKSRIKPTVRSTRALGMLYRQSCVFEETLQMQSSIEKSMAPSDLLTVDGWEEFREDAQEAYFDYKIKISYIQSQFGIENELMLLSESYSKTQKYLCGKNERSNAQDMVANLVKDVFQLMKERFETGFRSKAERKSKYLAKASAWYLVTRELNENNPSPFYGLPWTLSHILVDVVRSKRTPNLTLGRNISLTLKSHDCALTAFGSSPSPKGRNMEPVDNQIAGVKSLMDHWISVQRKQGHFGNNGGYASVIEQTKSIAQKAVDDVVNPLLDEENQVLPSLEVILVKVFQRLVDQVYEALTFSTNEVLSNLAISASMTLFRFLRKKDVASIFIIPKEGSDIESNLMTICLSLKPEEFGQYLKQNKRDFLVKLKGSGVKEVVCSLYPQSNNDFGHCMVSAIGSKRSLSKLRQALTRKSFYSDIKGTIEYY